MSLNVSASGGGDYQIVPEGVYIGKCFKIIDLGMQKVEWQGAVKEQKKVLISWELLGADVPVMKDKRPFAVSRKYTASLDDRGNLRKDLEAWRGRKFSELELENFDLKTVLGANCMIQVVHSDDGKYANVNSIMATKEKPVGINPLVSFDIDDPDMEIYDTFSDKMKEQISAAPEFQMAQRSKQAPVIEQSSEHFPSESNDPFDEEEPINLADIPF